MMETNTIVGTFFMLVALTFLVVIVVDRKKFFDHSSRSNNYTFALSSFSLSLFIGVYLLGGLQGLGPIGLWIMVIGLNVAIAILVLDKPRSAEVVKNSDDGKTLRGDT